MNIIVDDIEQVVKSKIPEEFNTDFRTAILFELLMQDNNITDRAKTIQSLTLFYPNLKEITNQEKAINNILWFYSCGKEKKASKNTKETNKKQIYSYEFDAELIYSAFKDQYGIDLQEVEYLHWWKFKAMFEGLREDNLIVKIMGYRAMDTSKIKDKEQKKYYESLKRQYKLPDMRTAEQKEADFGNAFW